MAKFLRQNLAKEIYNYSLKNAQNPHPQRTKMKVKDNTLHALLSLNGTDFVIPCYQRNYAWGVEQCEQLLADILAITSTEKQHFLGTMTYIVHSGARMIEFVIIDGQQRLTTIMLFLKALQQNPTIKKNESLQRRISNYLFDDDKAKVRLKPIKKDMEAFECVMSERCAQFSGKSNIVNNFRFFLRESRHFTEVQIEKMLATFSRLQIAEVVLDKSVGDDPQMVFERINATGLHLTGLDLIRNFLMMEHNSSEQERLFEHFWVKIEENFSNDKSDKTLQKFISVYLRIYYGVNLKDDETEIYKSFKNLRKEHFDDDSEQILCDMMKFARIYKIIIDKETFWQYENDNPKEKRILREKINLLDYLQFRTAYPFTMRLIDDFENARLDFENFNEILNLLISYFVRRGVCALPSLSHSGTLYPMYNRLIKEDRISANAVARYLGQRSGSEVFPNASMLVRNFENTALFKSKKIVSLVLYEIEKLQNHEVPELENLNIEHFYPQTPTPQWREMIGEEAHNLEQNYIDTLGNLTLTDSRLNSKIGNKSFEEKIKFYEDKGSLHLNRYFGNFDKWGIDEIKIRANELFAKFLEVEIFKDIGDEFRRVPELITLATDWTYIRPRYVKLPDGDKKIVKTYKNVARAIIQYLMANHGDELQKALNMDFSFIHFGEAKQMTSDFVDEDFGEFRFICKAEAEIIRQNLKILVKNCGLEPSEFEIIIA